MIRKTSWNRKLDRRILVWMIIACTPLGLCKAASPTDVVVERYTPEVTHDCVHILLHDKFELLTADSRFLWRASNRDAFQTSPLDGFQDAHSAAYHTKLKLYFATDTANHRMFSFRDPRTNEKARAVETIAGIKLDRPHDVVIDDDGWVYVINPNPPTTVFRFRDLGRDESALDLSAHLTYSRALSVVKNRLYVVGSSTGKIVEVADFANRKFMVHESYGKQQDAPAGSWTTTGLVPNDAEYFEGAWYVTNYFCPAYAHKTDYNQNKLIRFKTWDDFRTGHWDDLSSLLPDKLVPYYLTSHDGALYIAAFEHEDPKHPGGLWRLRKK